MSIELIHGFLQEQIEARWQSSGNILTSPNRDVLPHTLLRDSRSAPLNPLFSM